MFPWSSDLTVVAPPDRSGNYADVSAADTLPTTLFTYNDDFVSLRQSRALSRTRQACLILVVTWLSGCTIIYSLDFEAPAGVVEDPTGPSSGSYRVVRGSSWRSATLSDLRIASRDYSNGGRDDLGFRIARNLD